MNLMPGEELRHQFAGITVTSVRVRRHIQSDHVRSREIEFQSIMLEHVTSCKVVAVSQPVKIVLGVLFLCAGLVMLTQGRLATASVLLFFISAILIIAFFAGRCTEIEIASPTLHIKSTAPKNGYNECVRLIEEIERAISARFAARAPVTGSNGQIIQQAVPLLSGKSKVSDADYWGA